jgi:hypothetical protein
LLKLYAADEQKVFFSYYILKFHHPNQIIFPNVYQTDYNSATEKKKSILYISEIYNLTILNLYLACFGIGALTLSHMDVAMNFETFTI